MTDKAYFDRREFLKKMGVIGAGFYLAGCAKKDSPSLPTPFSDTTQSATAVEAEEDSNSASTQTPSYGDVYLSVARGEDAAELTRRAIAAIGGIERFVFPGRGCDH